MSDVNIGLLVGYFSGFISGMVFGRWLLLKQMRQINDKFRYDDKETP